MDDLAPIAEILTLVLAMSAWLAVIWVGSRQR